MKLKSNIKPKNVVIKCGADFLLPFAIVFGLAVILFGATSPGGGFQGGVIVASACLLIYLGYGAKTVTKVINPEFIRVNEAVGAILYVLLAVAGVFLGVRFCQNVFFDVGNVGDIISGGTISFMSFAVGYKVLTGVGFLLITMMSLLMTGSDSNEEE
ncbi:MAG: cation:proton antiporter [Firmicutes bacterium]|nr:cation:proton antiporter [Bacillota bacterium]